MCIVSKVSDNFRNTLPYRFPWVPTEPMPHPTPPYIPPHVSRAEFDKLRKEVEELKELLKAAKRYDEATGQPDCEVAEKVDLIKRIAKLVGVDMEDVFPK